MSDDQDRKAKVESLGQHGTLNRRPESVRNKLFTENGFFDPYDLIQVKYEMLRSVEEQKRSIREVTQEFGFSRPSFYQARRGLEQHGLAGLVPRKRGPKAAYKLKADIVEFVEQTRSANEALKPEDLRDMIRKKFGTDVHVRTVQRALRQAGKKGRR